MTTVRSNGLLSSLDASSSLLPMLPPSVGSSSTSWLSLMEDYASIWRTQPQVRKVCGFLSRNIAQLNLKLYRRISDTDRERIHDHAVSRAIAKPLGWRSDAKLTKFGLFETIVSDRAIFDNAYLLKLRNPADGQLRLMPVPPQMVTPNGQAWLPPTSYSIAGLEDGRVRTLRAAEVVHFRGYNPTDRRSGLSPIETLRQILLEDLASDHYREQLWLRGARMSGVIERPKDAPKWSESAARRFREDWQSSWAAYGPDAGGTPVLEDGMQWKATTFSSRDTQWLEAKRLTREEVAAAYYIPQPAIGILDRATFSNVTELHKSVYQDTLPPWLVSMEEDFDLQLLADYAELVSSDAYTEFDLAEKLKGDFDSQARALSSMVGAPILTRNEGRARLNLPWREDCDGMITPLNVLVGGQASPVDTAPPLEAASVDADELSHVIGRFVERCGRGVLGRWRQCRAGQIELHAVWQADRWAKELSSDLEALGDGFENVALQVLAHTRSGVFAALAAEDPDSCLAAYFDALDASRLVRELMEDKV